MAKKKTRKRNVQESKDLLGDWEFNPHKAKVMISIRLDGDVLDAIKSVAAQHEIPYQTLINQKLREVFMASENDAPDVQRLVALIQKLEERVETVEKEIHPPVRRKNAAG